MADSLPDREPILCRDCLADHAAGAGRPASRCPICGSPRLLRHPERDRLAIAHVDCDAFFAAIEKRDDPSLADKAVIIGGGKRGVVSTAAMWPAPSACARRTVFKTHQACPGAVVINPTSANMRKVGRQVRHDALPDAAGRGVSIIEAFLDLTGTEGCTMCEPGGNARPLRPARRGRDRHHRLGGAVHNKFLAQIASDLDKPRGFSILGRADAAGLPGAAAGIDLPASAKAAQEARPGRLSQIADCAGAAGWAEVALLGKEGERLGRLAHRHRRPAVRPEREPRAFQPSHVRRRHVTARRWSPSCGAWPRRSRPASSAPGSPAGP